VVRLLSGEAYFDVAPDKSRPFRVDLKRGSVTAVGTAFNIFSDGKTDQVLVTEGVVRVKQAQDESTPYPEAKYVRVREALSLSSTGLSPVRRSSGQLPWLQQTLSFDNTPLEIAVNELNRYLPSPVFAEDPTLAKLRVSGTFSTEAPDETLAALLAGFDLMVQSGGRLALSTDKTDR
jgi:transmembrane sensor